MIKTSIIALFAVAAIGSVAAPAFAEPVSPVLSHDDDSRTYDNFLDTHNVLARLHEQGINATEVESWGTLVRAFVVQPDGTQVSQLFTRDTLKPVTL
jgi:hypothetical protein